jgi:hypothetical protein
MSNKNTMSEDTLVKGTKGFDSVTFNKNFEAEKDKQKIINQFIDAEKLKLLNEQKEKKTLWQYNINEILIGLKDAWFDILDDLLQQNFNINIFTKEYRLFYIGLTFLIIGCIMYIYDLLENDDVKVVESEPKIIKHIYINRSHKLHKCNKFKKVITDSV